MQNLEIHVEGVWHQTASQDNFRKMSENAAGFGAFHNVYRTSEYFSMVCTICKLLRIKIILASIGMVSPRNLVLWIVCQRALSISQEF